MERLESIREASKQPEVFRLLHDRFDGRIPTANEPLRAFLIRELGFSKNGADECIKSLREFMNQIGEPELANLPEPESTGGDDVILSNARRATVISETAPVPAIPTGNQKRLSIPSEFENVQPS